MSLEEYETQFKYQWGKYHEMIECSKQEKSSGINSKNSEDLESEKLRSQLEDDLNEATENNPVFCEFENLLEEKSADYDTFYNKQSEAERYFINELLKLWFALRSFQKDYDGITAIENVLKKLGIKY